MLAATRNLFDRLAEVTRRARPGGRAGSGRGALKAGGEDGLEGGGGELRGSGEGDFHQAVIRAFLASLP